MSFGHEKGLVFRHEGEWCHIFAFPHTERQHERHNTCGGCGRAFVQYRLSDLFIACAATVGNALKKQFGTDYWSPHFCATCERKELSWEYFQNPLHDIPTRTTFVRQPKLIHKIAPIRRTETEW